MTETEDGRREFTDEQFINAIRSGAETTREIADEVGCTRRAADYRLRELRQDGRIEARKFGGSLLWSLADED
ncbi:MAG: helix-turn-helix domain-containing protein [Halobacteriales archaeon]|nr:helix-turn-helix domain-containing protein [Halobacteriales archaeon]